jgi:hypothetical protein
MEEAITIYNNIAGKEYNLYKWIDVPTEYTVLNNNSISFDKFTAFKDPTLICNIIILLRRYCMDTLNLPYEEAGGKFTFYICNDNPEALFLLSVKHGFKFEPVGRRIKL